MRASLCLLCLSVASPALATAALPAYSVDPSTVTIAGISSGGFMAVQMHVAYSSHIHGAAVFAGGPYDCAQGSALTATGACESGSGLTLSAFVNYTTTEASAGAIDPTSNLSGQPVYLFSGTDDTTVHQGTMNVLQQYYANYGSAVTYNNNTAAAHGWISPDGPNPCNLSYSPYISNCNLDPEQTFLTLFYGTLAAKNTGTLGGSFVQFDQTPFCGGGSCSAISLDTSGWLYVPASCAAGAACKLVVVLHGCLQGQSLVGQDLVKESGVNEWADTNGIVVLYPQAVSSLTSPSNPEDCWDWWGYTRPSYALQSGPQMQTLMAMITQITSGALGSTSTGGTSGGAASTGGSSSGAGTSSGSSTGAASTGGTSSGSGSGSTAGGGNGSSGGSAAGTTGSGSSSGGSGSTGSSPGSSTGASGGAGGKSGGCSSAGGPVSWLALLAAATLLRRRDEVRS